ncbi:hypothetical protein BDF20DRAFT_843728 [Mycotypha africana]|uniref:uncharacterized protein n=1 Tax=Mycotypha africana TaxID=64632 RepID=UPI00230070B9|nr:uncharacterized protein BDF20DRAFT_843728 [Mycotypha africana]KAI8991264.1 hypothetical protein BDF20DRAFT_843728 [Mycotypha africana]
MIKTYFSPPLFRYHDLATSNCLDSICNFLCLCLDFFYNSAVFLKAIQQQKRDKIEK